VVFLTAIKGDKEARIRALEVGAEAFLSKPIDEIELTAQIRAMQKIKAASTRERAEKDDLTKSVAARTHELDLAHTATLNLLEDLRKENKTREEGEARLRLLFENLPSGVVVHAPDTAVLFANPEALRLLGLTLEQMRGKTATDPAWCFLREDGAALALEDYPVNRLRASGKLFEGQIIGFRRPGRAEPNWVQCSAYPQFDASGQLSQVIVAFTDITERKQAQDALRESEQRHRDYLAHSPYGVFVADEQGRYVQVNPAACSITGYSEKELLSKSVADLHGEEGREDAARHFQAFVREGKSTGELKFRPKSGESRWWLVSAVKISDTRFLGFCNDITDRKDAEAKLKEQLDELRRWQAVTLGREDRVQELKREVNEACRRLGEPARYPSQEAGAPDFGEARP
jgi:PAS domain S-box-containing protein